MSQSEDAALVQLLQTLQRRGYQFTTPTPATHARAVARKSRAQNLRDVLGWSLPFQADVVDPEVLALLERGGVLGEHARGFISRIRVSTHGGACFMHSAYPTLSPDAVFFGPDSYRFARFVGDHLNVRRAGLRAVDIGTGAGIGAWLAAQMTKTQAVGTDINPLALRYAEINFRAAKADVSTHLGAGLEGVGDPIDIVIANPPYIADDAHRAYRDGGAALGAEVALSWARQAAQRLPRHGQFLLYTGSAIVGGKDLLAPALCDLLSGFAISYSEIDPDVFGEELERDDYADVDRIALVGVVATKR